MGDAGAEMIRKASSYSCLTSWAVASAAAVALLVQSVPAHAEEVSGSGKGITGGALLGGEAVMLVEAIAGVKPAWAYIVGGLVGAGGGAAGGYFIEKDGSAKARRTCSREGSFSSSRPRSRSFKRPLTRRRKTTPKTSPSRVLRSPSPRLRTAPVPGAALPAAAPPLASLALHYHWQPAKVKLPAGLLAMDDGAVSLAVPAVQVAPVYQMTEVQKFGLEQKHELRLPVFSATF